MHGTLPIFCIHTRVRLGGCSCSQHLHSLSAKICNLYHQGLRLTLEFTQCSNVLICFFYLVSLHGKCNIARFTGYGRCSYAFSCIQLIVGLQLLVLQNCKKKSLNLWGSGFLHNFLSGNWTTNSDKKSILYKDRHTLKIDMHGLYIDRFPATAVIPDVRRLKLPELPCIGPLDLTCIELLLYVHWSFTHICKAIGYISQMEQSADLSRIRPFWWQRSFLLIPFYLFRCPHKLYSLFLVPFVSLVLIHCNLVCPFWCFFGSSFVLLWFFCSFHVPRSYTISFYLFNSLAFSISFHLFNPLAFFNFSGHYLVEYRLTTLGVSHILPVLRLPTLPLILFGSIGLPKERCTILSP